MGGKNSKKKDGSKSSSSTPTGSTGKLPEIQIEPMKDSDWILHRMLGKGAFGTVMCGELKKYKGTLYALKYMNKAYIIEQNMVEKVMAEKEILRMVSHPFVCKLHYAYQTSTDVVMVLSLLIGNDLQYHLDSEKKLNEMGVRFYMAQLIHAVAYLHDLGIVHRDLKPGNILLDSKGNSYITDFGISAVIKPGQYLKSNCGTLHYMPPEVYRNELYNSGMDMWALGVIMYEMLYLCVPFDANSEKELMAVVCNKEPKWVSKNSKASQDKISDLTIDMIKKLLDKNKNTRITAQKAKEHPFFALTDWDQVITKSYLPPFTPSKEANSSFNMDFDQLNGEVRRPCTDKQQELFKNWDYNPGPPDESKPVVAAAVRTPSKQKIVIAAAGPLTQEDLEEEDETGAISIAEYKRIQEEKKAAKLAEEQRKKQEKESQRQQIKDQQQQQQKDSNGDIDNAEDDQEE